MCQVEEHEILLFVGKNYLNQLENLGTSNIFISFLFHTYMRIIQINPTINCHLYPLVIIFGPPFGFNHKHCRAIVRITGTARQLIAFGFQSALSTQTKTIVSPSPH